VTGPAVGLPDARLSRRPLTTADVPAVTALLAAAEEAEPAGEHWSEEDLAEEFTGPGVDLAGGSVGVFDGTELLAYGVVHPMPPGDSWSAHLDGAVHPTAWRRGLGGFVLRTLVAQAGDRHAREAPERPGELTVHLPEARPGVAALTAAEGFTVWRWFTAMRTELTGSLPEAVPAPPGVVLRGYLPQDDEAVRLASNEAFADHWRSRPMPTEVWRSRISGSAGFRPTASLVAVAAPAAGAVPHADGDAPVLGFLLVTEPEAQSERTGIRTAYVARVGTVRSARGRGIASALLTGCLPVLVDQGYRRAELDVDAASPTGANRIYERAGFTVLHRNAVAGRHLAAADPGPDLPVE
jgi:mycothiol synthase